EPRPEGGRSADSEPTARGNSTESSSNQTSLCVPPEAAGILRSWTARRKKNHAARPRAEGSLGLRARPTARAVQTSQAEERRALCAPDRTLWRTLPKRLLARSCPEATRVAQASAPIAARSPSIGLAVLVFPFHSPAPFQRTNRTPPTNPAAGQLASQGCESGS